MKAYSQTGPAPGGAAGASFTEVKQSVFVIVAASNDAGVWRRQRECVHSYIPTGCCLEPQKNHAVRNIKFAFDFFSLSFQLSGRENLRILSARELILPGGGINSSLFFDCFYFSKCPAKHSSGIQLVCMVT